MENLTAFDVRAANGAHAIRMAGNLLIEAGYVTERYVGKMIQTYESNTRYFVIAPGVAIPHQRPELGALKTGAAIITLKKPINFGNPANDPVDTVIAFSAADDEAHLNVVRQIAQFLQENVNSKNQEQLELLLKKILENAI
ncbi:PTS sugar transporter subunit IIA [Jeotgalibaca sp. A127]|uniref:PTS sugar transporter subunit IIA n=1 Tax=Jeotgalibaca sp. A127 TaxID=3457324 RepID=UPI003FD0DE62